jgi:hypothetical protein
MGNIHVLPTDKPSRIYLIKSNNRLGITSNNPEFTENFGSGTQNQNIYITSDEEIKEGDFVIHNSNIYEVIVNKKLYISVKELNHIDIREDLCKKIILTTDQNLIANGVQSIDDTFLEWFVENPSCESVEINSEKIHIGWEPDYSFEDKGIEGSKKSYQTFYKIIIPKEEPKKEFPQIGTKEWNDLASQYFGGKSKQEILEAFSKEVLEDEFFANISEHRKAERFIELGANWQAERMYSEEEVIEIILAKNAQLGIIGKTAEVKEWFKQYKKK